MISVYLGTAPSISWMTKLIKFINAIEEWALVFILLGLAFLSFVQVLCRYFLGFSFSWMYDERFSIGLAPSAGSLGIVIPPSIPMILYCLVMNTSVAKLFMAGFLPGFLIGGVFIAYTLVLAYKHQWFFGEKASWGDTFRALLDGIWALMLPVIVLG